VDFGGVFIQEPELRKLNFAGPTDGDPTNPQESNPWRWGHKVALSFKNGDHQAVYRHLNEMLAPVDEEWSSLPPKVVASRQPLEAALEMFSDADPILRSAAAAVASAIQSKDPQIHKSVKKLLNDPVFEVRFGALNAAANLGLTGLKKAINAGLVDSHPQMRQSAIYALSKQSNSTITREQRIRLAKLVSDSDEEVRRLAIKTLEERRDIVLEERQVRKILIQIIRHPQYEISREPITVLGLVSGYLRKSERYELGLALIEFLKTQNGLVCERAEKILTHLVIADTRLQSALMPLLSLKEWRQAVSAIVIIDDAKLSNDTALEVLLLAATGHQIDPYVKSRAESLLEKLSSDSVVFGRIQKLKEKFTADSCERLLAAKNAISF
jgi:hypothetical protein